jgi:bacterioferritin-associated ferredoxin
MLGILTVMAIACSCHGVRDHAVREAIDAGAASVDEIGETCRAGSTCGGCHPTLEALLAELGVPAVVAA